MENCVVRELEFRVLGFKPKTLNSNVDRRSEIWRQQCRGHAKAKKSCGARHADEGFRP